MARRSRPANPGGGLPSDTAQNRRAEVIHHAAKLFDERGYYATSMEDIADAVGLRKATLYHYVSSKDEILFWIHQEFMDMLIARQEKREEMALNAQQLVLENVADILEIIETHPGHIRAFYDHQRELPAREHAAMAAKRARYEQGITSSIQRGVDEGIFRSVDVKLASLFLFGACNWAYQWYRADGVLRSREIAYTFWDFLLKGFAAPDA